MAIVKDRYGRKVNTKYEPGTDSYYEVGTGVLKRRKKRKKRKSSRKRSPSKLSLLSFL